MLASRCRNLFSHQDSGPAGTHEAKHVGPKVPWIVKAAALAGDRERLARTGRGPEFFFGRPVGEEGREAPGTEAGKEVDLLESDEVIGLYLADAACIDHATRDGAGVGQVA